jgi:hypothetical protein
VVEEKHGTLVKFSLHGALRARESLLMSYVLLVNKRPGQVKHQALTTVKTQEPDLKMRQ